MNEMARRTQSTEVGAVTGNPYEAYAAAVNTRTIVGKILKFSKGDYTAGQHDEEVATGTRMVADMDELMVGWVKWSGGKPAEHRMGRVADAFQAPTRKDLGDLDKGEWETDDKGEARDPWQFSNYLITMDSSGQLYTLTTSSRGGLNAIGELCKHFGKMMRQKPDEFPVIELGVDSYKHSNKSYGKIYVPMFKIVGWMPKKGIEEALASEATRETEDKETDQAELAAAGDIPFEKPKEVVKEPVKTPRTPATNRAREKEKPASAARF